MLTQPDEPLTLSPLPGREGSGSWEFGYRLGHCRRRVGQAERGRGQSCLAPLPGCDSIFEPTGGLHCAMTSGYYLPTLRVERLDRRATGTELEDKNA